MKRGRKPKTRKQFTIIISTSSFRWRVSAKWTGIAMIVIIIWPALCCVFQMVRRCNYSNSTGNRLCRRILFSRVTLRHRNWIIWAFNIISFTLEFWSLTVLCLENKTKKTTKTQIRYIFILCSVHQRPEKRYYTTA